MIKNQKFWEEWEKELKRKTPINITENLRLLEGMYEQARLLKRFPPQDPLEGLDFKIRMVKDLHVSKSS